MTDGDNNTGMDAQLAEILGQEGLLNQGDMKAGEGIIAEGQKPYASVLQKIATIPEDVANYRQILLLANYLDTEESDRVSAALSEAKRYGLSIEPILDWAVNRCAVAGKHAMGRVPGIIAALTHMAYNTPTEKGKPQSQDKQQVQTNQSRL
ncbi:hypothetical protein ACFLXT_04325 [Chloroflexota bacterium]